MMEISQRAKKIFTYGNAYYLKDHLAVMLNKYDKQKNPDGYFSWSCAENILAWDYLRKCFEGINPFKYEGVNLYTVGSGYLQFRHILGKYLSDLYKFDVSGENIVVTNGSASIINNLIFCLCDANDYVLLPTPTYTGLPFDFGAKNEVNIYPLNTIPTGYKISREMLESAYESSLKENKKIKCLFIIHPNNPLGICYSDEELLMMVDFCRSKHIHFISDEDYCRSVYGYSGGKLETSFHSVGYLLKRSTGDDVHIFSSFSKEFGVAGFRCGYIYTLNKSVFGYFEGSGAFQNVGNHTQMTIGEFISNETQLSTFLSQSNTKLKESRELVESFLDGHNIPHTKGNSGFFVWVDLREFLKEQTFEGERKLVSQIWEEEKIVLCPGESCLCDVPGYFRLIFSFDTKDNLEVGLHRFDRFISRSRT